LTTQELIGLGGAILAFLGLFVAGAYSLKSKRVDREIAAEAAKVTTEVSKGEATGNFLDATGEIAKYMREEIKQEVERQVKPIRDELKKVRDESHEMNDAVRAHVTQQWLWDAQNRPGPLPMLPVPILRKLGLVPFDPTA
jgi:gas vesicle protein